VSARLVGILLVLACTAVEGLAQICLKQSTRQPGRRASWIAAGVGLFVVEALLYTAALQRLEVSVAYSLGAMSFVVVALGAAWLLGEPLPVTRRLGIAFIVAGCAVLAAGG
jgi:multidrug transporter EmrE-like cation transporter